MMHGLTNIKYMNSCFIRLKKVTTVSLNETAWEVTNLQIVDNNFSLPHCISLDDIEYFEQGWHLSQQFNSLAPLSHRGKRAYFTSLMFLHTVWVLTVLRNLIRKGNFLRRSYIVLCNFFHEIGTCVECLHYVATKSKTYKHSSLCIYQLFHHMRVIIQFYYVNKLVIAGPSGRAV